MWLFSFATFCLLWHLMHAEICPSFLPPHLQRPSRRLARPYRHVPARARLKKADDESQLSFESVYFQELETFCGSSSESPRLRLKVGHRLPRRRPVERPRSQKTLRGQRERARLRQEQMGDVEAMEHQAAEGRTQVVDEHTAVTSESGRTHADRSPVPSARPQVNSNNVPSHLLPSLQRPTQSPRTPPPTPRQQPASTPLGWTDGSTVLRRPAPSMPRYLPPAPSHSPSRSYGTSYGYQQGGRRRSISSFQMPSNRRLPDLLAMTPGELGYKLNGEGRAKKVWKVLRDGADPWMMEPRELEGRYGFSGAFSHIFQTVVDRPPVDVAGLQRSADGAVKMDVRLGDGERIETMLLPHVKKTSVCISTQVGCSHSCRPCASGAFGLRRNLEVDEIVGQVYLAIKLAREYGLPPVQTCVVAGMGEPTENIHNLSKACEILLDQGGFAFGPSRLSVSTMGPSPEAIHGLANLNTVLSWALLTADQEARRLLVPTMTHSLEELRDAFEGVIRQRRDSRNLFIELLLIVGITDLPEQIDSFVSLIDPLTRIPGKDRVRLNLLPFSPWTGSDEALRTPSRDRIQAFRDAAHSYKFTCTVREPRGLDIQGACGQLQLQHYGSGTAQDHHGLINGSPGAADAPAAVSSGQTHPHPQPPHQAGRAVVDVRRMGQGTGRVTM
ncbi:unnamed protein product [Vitrella brassicaformis CCMP3155]|uniref:Radical SAM core domain-containing protein n=2 Tax=Vitrella brassicaformis TaxID=1169539 RepID=A0A0G4FR20_VITBC|nr:unnamed protein product [Vitrella brassicaformis CCMP3155]|eukprot:CEM16905.1 unnamed protein product [Vitrella brassicaformis CCMP3155]